MVKVKSSILVTAATLASVLATPVEQPDRTPHKNYSKHTPGNDYPRAKHQQCLTNQAELHYSVDDTKDGLWLNNVVYNSLSHAAICVNYMDVTSQGDVEFITFGEIYATSNADELKTFSYVSTSQNLGTRVDAIKSLPGRFSWKRALDSGSQVHGPASKQWKGNYMFGLILNSVPTKDNPTSKGTIELELWLQWTRGYDPVSAKGHYVETVDFFNKHWKLYEGTVGEGADQRSVYTLMPVTDYGDEGQVSFELKEWLDALVKAKVITNDLYVNGAIHRKQQGRISS